MIYFCVTCYIIYRIYKVYHPNTIDLSQATYLEDRIDYHNKMCLYYTYLKDSRNNKKKRE